MIDDAGTGDRRLDREIDSPGDAHEQRPRRIDPHHLAVALELPRLMLRCRMAGLNHYAPNRARYRLDHGTITGRGWMIDADVHSGEDVILTATGPGSELVAGQMENTKVF